LQNRDWHTGMLLIPFSSVFAASGGPATTHAASHKAEREKVGHMVGLSGGPSLSEIGRDDVVAGMQRINKLTRTNRKGKREARQFV
jgi:hypothetical protein